MNIRLDVDQLGVDADPITQPTDAPFEQVSYTEVEADLLGVNRLVPIGECRIARYYEHIRQPRQIGRQILSNPICEVLLLGIGVKVGERQYDDRQALSGDGLADCLRWRRT